MRGSSPSNQQDLLDAVTINRVVPSNSTVARVAPLCGIESDARVAEESSLFR